MSQLGAKSSWNWEAWSQQEFVFVDDWYLTVFLWPSLSSHLPHSSTPSFLMMCWDGVLSSLFSKMPSHQIQTHCGNLMLTPLPQMQWCFRYWDLERYQEFEGTLLSIGGTLAVPYTRDTAPDLSSLSSCHFLQPAYVSWAQGPPFMTIISHLIIMSFSGFSGQGGGIIAEPQKWMFDSLLLSFN